MCLEGHKSKCGIVSVQGSVIIVEFIANCFQVNNLATCGDVPAVQLSVTRTGHNSLHHRTDRDRLEVE